MKCEKCNHEYDDSLLNCPYCEKSKNEETETAENEKSDNSESFFDMSKISQCENVSQNTEVDDTIAQIQQVGESNITVQFQQQNQQLNEQNNTLQNNLFCKYCGGSINANGNYCMTCGRSSVDENIRHCPNCGLTITADTTFCTRCGNKITHNKSAAKFKQTFNKKKKTIVTLIISVLILAIVGGVGIVVVPKVFASPYTIMAEADYERAYKRANKNIKEDVLYENIVAVCCNEIKGGLKNPSSFELQNVWVDKNNSRIVLLIGGTNSYGGMVKNYYLYEFDEDDNCYEYYNSISDFEEKEYNSWDDYEDEIEKLIDNLTIGMVKPIVNNDSYKLTNGIVERINNLNKNNKLGNVKLLDEVKEIYPNQSKSEKTL